MECLVKRSEDDWKCDVYIYYVEKQEHTHCRFGPTLTNSGDVAERVRRAQQACLNASIRDPERFLRGQEFAEKREQSFTKNYVSIQISGPGLVDLSFVDLPGQFTRSAQYLPPTGITIS